MPQSRSMIQLYLRTVFIMILILSVLLCTIPRPPIPNSDVRQLLQSEDCAAPCFMGIHPGMTAVEALALLEAHDWVASVENRTAQNTGGYIYWRWEPDAPAWIDTSRKGTLWVTNRRVHQFWVDTRYALGEWMIQLGQPDIAILDDTLDTIHNIYQYRGVHAAAGLVVMSWQRCATADPYHGRASLKFRDTITGEELASMMYLDQWTPRFRQCAFEG